MGKEIVEQNKSPTPGIGVGGLVMCPYLKGPCLKGGCEFWVELKYGKNWVGHCAEHWKIIVAVEQGEAITKSVKGVYQNAPAKKGSSNTG